jgi:aarF domain-containing kinase
MGFSTKEVMDTMIATMSAMTFKWGFVHCDPHPGNILVRPHPKDPKRPQVVSTIVFLMIDPSRQLTLDVLFRFSWITVFVRSSPLNPKTSANSKRRFLSWTDQDLPDKFRREYTSLWKSLFTLDTKEIQRIAVEWSVRLLHGRSHLSGYLPITDRI